MWFWRILGKNESISFEIIVENQTIFFQAYVPVRLITYIKSILVSSYPEIVIKEIQHDSLDYYINPKPTHDTNEEYFFEMGSLALRNAEHLSIKTYKAFHEVDTLAPILSTLSKLEEHDKVVLQYIVSKSPKSILSSVVSSTTTESTEKPSTKEKDLALRVSIRMALGSTDKQRSKNLLENLASAYETLNDHQGNSLRLKKTYLFKGRFLKHMKARDYKAVVSFHLSLEEMATLMHMPSEKLSTIPNIAWGKNLLGEPPEDLPVVTKDMDPEVKRDINVFAKTEFKNKEVIYGLKRSDRRRHMYVIGKTGTGKSTLLANMAINDLKNDEGMCVIDPHGDLVETLLNYIPKRRINDVIYFDPSDTERTVKLNLFEGENVVHRELIASGIVSVFKKLYAYSWGPRLEYILRNSLLTLLKTDQARLSDVLDLLVNQKFRDGIVEKLDDPILKSFWVDEYDKMLPKQRTESIASILNKVGQFVSSPLVRNIVNARKSSFSIEDAMSEGKILLVNLSQGKLGEDNATLLGSMLITKIQLAAMGRVNLPEEERKDFYLYVDEFQNFATDSFTKILSEARKYRLDLILANQYIAQIPEEVQKAIFGNCGSMVSFVMGADDASVFTKEFGSRYSQEDLVSLSRYQIINKLSIDNIVSKPFPALTLPLATSSNLGKDKVVQVSRERYAK
ncbi:MAG: hypothetical protein BroJett025_11310 [Patescibacteria group bacterium]|nr:MAG: hypothetical protein BroJett025_11310 [Patescibacteria group bacterium]